MHMQRRHSGRPPTARRRGSAAHRPHLAAHTPAPACVRSREQALRNPPEKLASSTRRPTRKCWSQRRALEREREETRGLGAGELSDREQLMPPLLRRRWLRRRAYAAARRCATQLRRATRQRPEKPSERAVRLIRDPTFGIGPEGLRDRQRMLSRRAGRASAIPLRDGAPSGQGRRVGRRRQERHRRRSRRAS